VPAMPIYEFYCPDNHRIYQFYARTLAQGRTVPGCPDNPRFRMRKILSPFAVTGSAAAASPDAAPTPDDARMEAAAGEMEREFAGVDESDPRAMGRMMRRMAGITGEKLDGEMEAVVRKLEEGADPDSLAEQLGGDGGEGADTGARAEDGGRKSRARLRRAPVRDPRLHDYP
jgi:hypothetical protein